MDGGRSLRKWAGSRGSGRGGRGLGDDGRPAPFGRQLAANSAPERTPSVGRRVGVGVGVAVVAFFEFSAAFSVCVYFLVIFRRWPSSSVLFFLVAVLFFLVKGVGRGFSVFDFFFQPPRAAPLRPPTM